MSSSVSTPADASAKLLDVQAVAELLGCSPRHIYRLADAGRMPAPVKLGSLVRWKLSGPGSISEWLDQGCPASRKEVRRCHAPK